MAILTDIFQAYKTRGLYGVKRLVQQRFLKPKVKKISSIGLYLKYFNDKKGIEIGGPSPIFSKEIPIYSAIDSLDGCNFSNQTVWEGKINEGNNYNYFKDKKGTQFICEASNLKDVPDEKYDFLLASHCLEHCANTFKTVNEWLRVIKKGGAILLILPDRRFTFDNQRPVTSFGHLKSDFEKSVDETDLTHLDEIVALHDLKMDPAAGTSEQFKTRSLDNLNNRCLHHHVFDFDLLKEIYAHHHIKVIDTTFAKPYHQIILGIKQ